MGGDVNQWLHERSVCGTSRRRVTAIARV